MHPLRRSQKAAASPERGPPGANGAGVLGGAEAVAPLEFGIVISWSPVTLGSAGKPVEPTSANGTSENPPFGGQTASLLGEIGLVVGGRCFLGTRRFLVAGCDLETRSHLAVGIVFAADHRGERGDLLALA